MKSYNEIILSKTADDKRLREISNHITSKYGGIIISEIRGLDSIYIDFKIGACNITLHQETFVGIVILPTEKDFSSKEENDLIKAIGLELKEYF